MAHEHLEDLHATRETAHFEQIGPVGTLLALVGLLGYWGFFYSSPSAQPLMAKAYLYGYIFWVLLALGCLGLTVLHHLVRGSWGLSILRILEAGGSSRTFLWMLVGFIPVLLNLQHIYPWVNPGTDHVLLSKATFYNPVAFSIRAVLLFLLWAGMAHYFKQSALKQDETMDGSLAQTRTNFAAPGFIVLGLSITLMATDWVMSMDPHWYSTMFGPIFMISGSLAAFALATFLICVNHAKRPYSEIISPDLTKDLGNLLLTNTLLWAYFNFSQYVIIWNGNLPATAKYYMERTPYGWNIIGCALIVGCFIVPFVALLSPSVKRYPMNLARVAAWIFIMRIPDVYFIVAPMYKKDLIVPGWESLSFVAMGGLWLAAFGGGIRIGALYPAHDRRLLEAKHHAS